MSDAKKSDRLDGVRIKMEALPILREIGLNGDMILCYFVMYAHASNGERKCWALDPKITRELGFAMQQGKDGKARAPRSLKRWQERLKDVGLIYRTKTKGGRDAWFVLPVVRSMASDADKGLDEEVKTVQSNCPTVQSNCPTVQSNCLNGSVKLSEPSEKGIEKDIEKESERKRENPSTQTEKGAGEPQPNKDRDRDPLNREAVSTTPEPPSPVGEDEAEAYDSGRRHTDEEAKFIKRLEMEDTGLALVVDDFEIARHNGSVILKAKAQDKIESLGFQLARPNKHSIFEHALEDTFGTSSYNIIVEPDAKVSRIETTETTKPERPRTAQLDNSEEEMVRLVERWNACADRQGLPKVKRVNRNGEIWQRCMERFKDPEWVEQYPQALDRMTEHTFTGGRKWPCTLSWFTKPDSVDRVLQGDYHSKNVKGNRSFENAAGDEYSGH